MFTSTLRRRIVPALTSASTSAAIASAMMLAMGGSVSYAQGNDPLIDILVRKGVLSDVEAEEVRTELKKENEQSSAAKIKLSNSVQELRLYGDLRLRYQYDSKDPQLDPPGVGVDFPTDRENPTGNQRSRWRFRLRLNADFKLAENIFGGVELSTALASDSANQTFEDGFDDYPIFISKAYLGWNPTEWLTLTAGKVPNPFYTTDLVWDPDITPTGLTERLELHELLWSNRSETAGYSKDGKAVAGASFESPWELTLAAGQFIFDDNIEGGGSDIRGASRDNDETTDAYLFQTQLVVGYRFSKDIKFTIAPGWLVYNAASAEGLENANRFEDNEFVSGATRNINLLLLPGDVSFRLAGIKSKFYWDFSYNIEGDERVQDIYRIPNHGTEDNYAFLVGLLFGENKKAGDWSVLANYRRIGLGSLDPNLSDSDFGDGELNMQGFRVGLLYNLTDFAIFGLTYNYAWQLRDIRGGEATGGNEIADANEVQTLQVDLNVKF